MIATVEAADPRTLAGFDAVIDVRSPAEFAEDRLPGAINLPVLSNAERALVGETYVQDDSFLARRMGAALVARNIARHLEGPLAGIGGGWRPLVYCWRGGQRSNAMASVLSQVGWRTSLLRGGYKTYRRAVVRSLYDTPLGLRLAVLGGATGVGKTQVLQRLAERGVQVLDLEALAEHRGSLFGALEGRAQPSQKLFESRLLAALDGMDAARPVVVEAESSRVGERVVPPALWAAMAQAPLIELEAPLEVRARRLVALYGAEGSDRGPLAAALDRLPRHIGRAEVARWREALQAGDLHRLATELVQRHYDPSYARSRGPAAPLQVIRLTEDSAAAIDRACEAVAACLGEKDGAHRVLSGRQAEAVGP